MREIIENAFAKLNLSLDVVSKFSDGYHELCMVMQSVSLCDDVAVTLRDDGVISVESDLRYLPSDERNIAYKAARAFFEKHQDSTLGADIKITKRIPVCAGMGGGSSDGAAVLRALNRLTNRPFSRAELENIGAELGSDIPFCIAGGTCLAKGRGELLSDLKPLPMCKIIICKPRFSVSTPELFEKIDSCAVRYHPDTQGLLSGMEHGSLLEISRRMYNVFEGVLPTKPDDVQSIKNALLDFGALGAVMTGTGSSVFGIFDSDEKASAAEAMLLEQYREVFSAVPLQRLEI
ncbi:MAG: 4-(cytidine 5'-diphospho)-2-C-methyl-D-erythritol kinase [Oscillospiraceae bacterium]